MSPSVLVTCLAVGLMLPGSPAGAQTPAPHTVAVDIAPQPLDLALNALAEQTGLQLLFRASRVTKGMKVARLTGTYTPRQALDKLLANTGLKYEYLDAQTVTILSESDPDASRESNDTRSDSASLHLTRFLQLAQAKPVERRDGEAPAPEQKSATDMIVEGQRDKRVPYKDANVDLPRSIDDVKPYYIFDARQLENSGSNNIEDFLAKRLPMQTGGQIYSNLSPNSVTGHVRSASQINMRGFGVDQTLILVNGRRLPGIVGAFSPEPTQPDLNGIPLSAVERIEVMPSSASGIYGGGAVGGVINVILKRNYAGFETKLGYENTFDSDAAKIKAELTAGFSLEGGRTQVLLAGSYTEANRLTVGDRIEAIQAARNRVWTNAPRYQFDLPPLGATPNIYTSSPSLTLKGSGTSLGSQITHLPAGYRGVALDGTAGLLANANRFNLTIPDTAQTDTGMKAPLGATPRIPSFIANVRRQMNDRLEVFLDLAYADNYTTDTLNQVYGSMSVPASSPANPFNETVSINVPDDSENYTRFNRLLTRRLAGGFNLQLPRNWQLQADHSWSHNQTSYDSYFPDSVARAADLNNGTLNLFVDTLLYPRDFSAYRASAYMESESRMDDTSVRAFGPVFSLPGGAVNLAATLNHRKVGAPDTFYRQLFPNRPAANTTTVNPARSSVTDSLYVEATLPLVGSRNARPGIRMLEFQVAARTENYEVKTVRTITGAGTYALTATTPTAPALVSGTAEYSSTDPTVGFRYKPFEDLMLRVSWSSAFRPPSYSALQAPLLSAAPTTSVLDRRRNNAQTFVYTLSGGNPDLRPEIGENWIVGLILTPRALPGLRVSLDYTRIEKQDNIGSLSAQLIVDAESEFPDRVVRNAPGPGETVGVISTVQTSALNLYAAKIDSADLSVSYMLNTARLGTFNFSVLGTKLITAVNQTSRTTPPRDNVGRMVVTPGGLEFRGSMMLDWERKQWAAGWSMAYYGEYFTLGPPYTGVTAWALAQGAPQIPSTIFHDLYASYRVPATAQAGRMGSWFADTQFQLGIKNVLNDLPQFDASSATTGLYYGTFGDLRLRSYWFNLKKRF